LRPNILHITPDFNYACGRSYYVFLLSKYLIRNRINVYIITNGGDSLDRLEENKIPFMIVKFLKSKNPISFTKIKSILKDFIIKYDINIIHSHHRYSELIAIQTSRSLKNKKVKTIFTSLSIVKRKYNIEYQSDKIIAVSNTIKNILIKRFNINESKIEFIPNFVDTEETKVYDFQSGSVCTPGKYFTILSVGRFHADKNFEVLLKAMRILNDKTIKLYLVGEGPRLVTYQKYISKYKLNVEVVKPQKNLSEYFSIADLCVLPSKRDPFPNFMLQSGLHKKPFIGSNIDGIAELIKNGENGLLFESGDAQELAEKIQRMKYDEKLKAESSFKLHNDVMNNYTQEILFPKIYYLYKNILNN
jgi:glycosyltransferase involved in cell wall biosynthesis